MKEYTEKTHGERVKRMLEKKEPCLCCPARTGKMLFTGSKPLGIAGFKHPWYGTEEIKEEICVICRDFIGMKVNSCPCHQYGKKIALKKTWLALERKGYI